MKFLLSCTLIMVAYNNRICMIHLLIMDKLMLIVICMLLILLMEINITRLSMRMRLIMCLDMRLMIRELRMEILCMS